jgi:hypothetical protein
MAPSIRKKLGIASPTSGSRSVGIVRSRTQTMESFYQRISFSKISLETIEGSHFICIDYFITIYTFSKELIW